MINKVLDLYHFKKPKAEFIRHNENITYKITDLDKAYVLRMHTPSEGFNLQLLRNGMDTISLIAGEMQLLQYLADNGSLQTQKVELNIYGQPVSLLNDGTPATVLEWVSGTTLDSIDITAEVARKLGIMIGKLHAALAHRAFQNRYSYNAALLERMISEASGALQQGHFNKRQTEIITNALACIKDYLNAEHGRFILVHADLGKTNLIYNNGEITPIDFSLSGYCIPEMDLASAFCYIEDYAFNEEILNGYASICGLRVENYGIEICLCLQILLFIINQHNRFANEAWFQEKLNDWCEKNFLPLLDKAK